jgi:L-asparaginase/Glu-tRNA(Gln) amidotransferase subunit D
MTQALRGNDAHPAGTEYVVGLVLTGGTIGAEDDGAVLSVGQGPTQAESRLVAAEWPGKKRPSVAVRHPLRQLSENLEPAEWVPMAAAVRELVDRDGASGVLVFHGTDTMSYTAAALSFLLSDVDVPIVLTGSNLPSSQAGSDAGHNVHTALVAMQALGPGTYLSFAGGPELPGVVHLGTHVRKLRASGAAFTSVDRERVGVVRSDVFQPIEPYERHQPSRGYVQRVDDHVLALRLYPGLDFNAAFEAVRAGKVRGVVLELYASATGPTETDDRFSITRFIERCSQESIAVVTTVAESPEPNGKTYETTIAIEQAGGRFLAHVLPETATVKMMWALGQTDDPDEVRDLMSRPIAGEFASA